MKNTLYFFGIGMVAVLTLSTSDGFSEGQAAQNRIPQQVVINGQMVNGAFVTTAGGQLQSYTCATPQHYATADSTSQGWACYEQTTGVWLLNALPPAQAQAAPAPQPVPQQQPIPQQQPPVIYQQAPPPVYQQAPPPVIYQQAPPPVVYQQAPPSVIYQQAPPTVIYQQAPPTVIYQAPPTVIYQQPVSTVVYTAPPSPVVVEPAYPSSVVLGRAAINAAGRIASAAIISSRHPRGYYYDREPVRGRHW
jgi:hypothetical protein